MLGTQIPEKSPLDDVIKKIAEDIEKAKDMDEVRLLIVAFARTASKLTRYAKERSGRSTCSNALNKIKDFIEHYDFFNPPALSSNNDELFKKAWNAYCKAISQYLYEYQKNTFTRDYLVQNKLISKELLKKYSKVKKPLELLSLVDYLNKSIQKELLEIINNSNTDINTISSKMAAIRSNCNELKDSLDSLDVQLPEILSYKQQIQRTLEGAYFSDYENVLGILIREMLNYKQLLDDNEESPMYIEKMERAFKEFKGYLLSNTTQLPVKKAHEDYLAQIDTIYDDEIGARKKLKFDDVEDEEGTSLETDEEETRSKDHQELIEHTKKIINNLPQLINNAQEVIFDTESALLTIHLDFYGAKNRLQTNLDGTSVQISELHALKNIILKLMHHITSLKNKIPSESHNEPDLVQAFKAYILNEISSTYVLNEIPSKVDNNVEQEYRKVISKYAKSSTNTEENDSDISFSSFKRSMLGGVTPYSQLTDSARKQRRMADLIPDTVRKAPSSSARKKGVKQSSSEHMRLMASSATPRTPFTPVSEVSSNNATPSSPSRLASPIDPVIARSIAKTPSSIRSLKSGSKEDNSPVVFNFTLKEGSVSSASVDTPPSSEPEQSAATLQSSTPIVSSQQPYPARSPANIASSSTLNSNDEPLTTKTEIQPESTITTTTLIITTTNITTAPTNTSAPATITKEADAAVDAWEEPYIKQSQILLTAVKNKENKYKESLILLNEYISKAKLSGEVKKKVEEVMRSVSKMDSTLHSVSSNILLSTLGLLFDPKNKEQLDAYNQLGKQLIKDKPHSPAAKAVSAAMLALGALILTLGILICVGTLGAGITAGAATTTAGAVLLVTGGLGLFSARSGAIRREHLEQISGNMNELRVLAPRG